MSQHTIDTIEIIGGICGIAAFLNPIIVSLLNFLLPYLAGATLRLTKLNLKLWKNKLEFMNSLYQDHRRLSVWNSSVVASTLRYALFLIFGSLGVWLCASHALSNNYYVNILLAITFSLLIVVSILRIVTAGTAFKDMMSPDSTSLKILKNANTATKRVLKAGSKPDQEMGELKSAIEKLVADGAWNDAPQAFTRV